jgi:beta-phosphoglucomutase
MDNKKCIATLFDLDGVVFDTEPQYTVFWGSQCRLYHPELPGLEHRIKGMTLQQIYLTYFDDVKDEQPIITRRLNEFEKSMSFNYIAGFENFIKKLRCNGVKTAVVTSSNIEKMESVYHQRPEFRTLFDAILTSEMFNRSKPDPDCYLLGARTFDTITDNCIVFEDSFNGLKSGRAANMAVVGLATTNTPKSIAPFCDIVIDDYTDFTFQSMMRLLQD